jgi:hypothetical protein
MKAYRIDKRDFQIGNLMTSQNEYQNLLDEKRLSVEKILESNRPEDKPRRNDVIMLFQEFKDAKHFWTIMTNSKFYKSEIDELDILHIGDFNKVESIFVNIDNTEEAIRLAKEYWESKFTDRPKPELLLNCASVSKIISNSELERKNAFAERVGLANNGIKIINEE